MARRRTRGGASKGQVGYAVVGMGHIAQKAVLPAFAHARGDAKLVALVSGDPKRQRELSRRYAVPVFGYHDYEECLRMPEVEAVYIALPNHMHTEYAVRAARAGVHVLCEKPMALSEAECREMIAACDENDVRLMIAYRLHFDEANLAMVKRVRDGSIGDPRVFTSTFTLQVPNPDNIRLDASKGGGVFWDIGLYCINAARYLFRDEPYEVMAFTDRGPDPRFAEVEESAGAVLRFPGGRLASFTAGFGAEPTAVYEVVGTKGGLCLDNAYEYEGPRAWELWRGGRQRQGSFPSRDQFAPELIYFSRCVRSARAPEPDGWEGLADVRIVEALYQSARTGRKVALSRLERRRRPSPRQRISRPAVQPPREVERGTRSPA